MLNGATAKPGVIDTELYAELRKGVLGHISIEDRIVLPAIANGREAGKHRLRNGFGGTLRPEKFKSLENALTSPITPTVLDFGAPVRKEVSQCASVCS